MNEGSAPYSARGFLLQRDALLDRAHNGFFDHATQKPEDRYNAYKQMGLRMEVDNEGNPIISGAFGQFSQEETLPADRADLSPTMGADPVSAGARAAGLLEEACQSALGSANPLRLAVVRDLALDIKRELDVIANEEDAASDLLAEATLRCADLANLAACNAPELPPDAAPRAVAAARLAAGAVRTLRPLVEAGSEDLSVEHAGNLLRDVRGAAWRAEFAARLVDESSDDEVPG